MFAGVERSHHGLEHVDLSGTRLVSVHCAERSARHEISGYAIDIERRAVLMIRHTALLAAGHQFRNARSPVWIIRKQRGFNRSFPLFFHSFKLYHTCDILDVILKQRGILWKQYGTWLINGQWHPAWTQLEPKLPHLHCAQLPLLVSAVGFAQCFQPLRSVS